MHSFGADRGFDLSDPIPVRSIDRDIEAELLRALELVWGARGPDYPRAHHERDLHSRRSNPATHGVNEHRFTGAKPESSEERVVCGEKDFRNRGGIFPRQRLWNRYRFALVRAQVFRVTAAADDSHHPVADFPKGRRLSDGIDLARVFHPRHIGRHTRGNGIIPLSLHEIRAIERRRSYAHTNLPNTRLRLRPLLNLEHLRPAWPRNNDSLHID